MHFSGSRVYLALSDKSVGHLTVLKYSFLKIIPWISYIFCFIKCTYVKDFNSLINEGPSKMLQLVRRIRRTWTYIGNQECWNQFANRCKTILYPQENNQLHLHQKNYFAFLGILVILTISFLQLNLCKTAQRQWNAQITQQVNLFCPFQSFSQFFWHCSYLRERPVSFIHSFFFFLSGSSFQNIRQRPLLLL